MEKEEEDELDKIANPSQFWIICRISKKLINLIIKIQEENNCRS